MKPSRMLPLSGAPAADLRVLGQSVRLKRRALGVSVLAAAESAGMSRSTWQRLEGGSPSVARRFYARALGVLVIEKYVPATTAVQAQMSIKEVDRIPLADYPELRRLTWYAPGLVQVTAAEALNVYERHWRHLDHDALTLKEAELIRALHLDPWVRQPLV